MRGGPGKLTSTFRGSSSSGEVWGCFNLQLRSELQTLHSRNPCTSDSTRTLTASFSIYHSDDRYLSSHVRAYSVLATKVLAAEVGNDTALDEFINAFASLNSFAEMTCPHIVRFFVVSDQPCIVWKLGRALCATSLRVKDA